MLPGMNGADGAVRLLSLLPGLRVVLVSAYLDQAHIFEREAVRVGAEVFVPKDQLDLELARSWNTGGNKQ